jgi:ABC-2 type transport system ATP-binding protein
MISARQVAYADGSAVLHDVALHVSARECLGLVSDAVHATALLQVLAGWLEPRAGSIHVQDEPRAADSQQLRRAVAYAPVEAMAVAGLRVDEYLAFIARARHARMTSQAVTAAASRAGLDPTAAASTLSRSGRAALAIAAVLVAPADAVLIDRGLDLVAPDHRATVISWLGEVRDRGAAMIVATDDADARAALCHRFVVLDRGRIAEASSGVVMQDGTASPGTVTTEPA